MDAITYFMVNYGLYSLLLIVPAALLGAGLGWFTWGKYRAGELESRQRLEEAEQVTEEAEIALSKERERLKTYRETAGLKGSPGSSSDLERTIVDLQGDNEELEKILKVARKERSEVEASLAAMAQEKTSIEEELAVVKNAREELEKELASATAGASASGQSGKKDGGGSEERELAAVTRNERRKFKVEKRALEKELASAERDLRRKLSAAEKSANRQLKTLEKKTRGLEKQLEDKAAEVPPVDSRGEAGCRSHERESWNAESRGGAP